MNCSYIRLQANKARSVVATVRQACVLVGPKTASYPHILVCLCCLLCQWLAGIHNRGTSSFRGTANKRGAGNTTASSVSAQGRQHTCSTQPCLLDITCHRVPSLCHKLAGYCLPQGPTTTKHKGTASSTCSGGGEAPPSSCSNRRGQQSSCCKHGCRGEKLLCVGRWATQRSSLTRSRKTPKPHTHTHDCCYGIIMAWAGEAHIQTVASNRSSIRTTYCLVVTHCTKAAVAATTA